MHIFMYPRRFYSSHLCIHITIPDFSPSNLRWNYSDKTDILKSFHFEYIKSFVQSNQTQCFLSESVLTFYETKMKIKKKKYSIQTSHFHVVISEGRS